jgi:hypothetical protein
MHLQRDDLLVVRPVEDPDPSPFRKRGGDAPQEVVIELLGRRLPEADDLHALRVHAAHHVLDRQSLPARHRLQNDEERHPVTRPQLLCGRAPRCRSRAPPSRSLISPSARCAKSAPPVAGLSTRARQPTGLDGDCSRTRARTDVLIAPAPIGSDLHCLDARTSAHRPLLRQYSKGLCHEEACMPPPGQDPSARRSPGNQNAASAPTARSREGRLLRLIRAHCAQELGPRAPCPASESTPPRRVRNPGHLRARSDGTRPPSQSTPIKAIDQLIGDPDTLVGQRGEIRGGESSERARFEPQESTLTGSGSVAARIVSHA